MFDTGFIKDTIRLKDNFWRAQQLFPRIWGEIDTTIFDKYFTNKQTEYGNLNWGQIIGAVGADAIVRGEVIQVQRIKDTTKCYFYKTLLAVRVDEVLHAYFSLKKGDIVLISRITGYTGGCTPGRDLVSVVSHYKEYEQDSEGLFALSRIWYDKHFLLCKKNGLKGYDDEYCPNMFRLFDGFTQVDYNDKKTPKDIKSLFNKK